ncbi:MAG: hypothetical protein Q9170_001454 [Blastenia crenularia]
MAESRQEAYCTLLMSDDYLPGAMVLAHSLLNSGTRKQLAVLVTMNTLQPSTIEELKKVYQHLISVDQIINKFPANLYLMNRPDLGSTFTKIALWEQTKFQKIVYLDADMVALRAPDELFDQGPSFAAVPDIGWPDCFNSGLLVLTPNMGDYYGLLALAHSGVSFDGADQGLLNIHFKEWQRLSFTYNCTLTGNYQYVPAYRHFQSSIKMVHFIGSDKPWKVGRDWKGATGVHEELRGRWWAVYDQEYHASTATSVSGQTRAGVRTVQQYIKGEASGSDFGFSSISLSDAPATPPAEQQPTSADWDPARPEAAGLTTQMSLPSSNQNRWQPPTSYPAPPNDPFYEVPSTPPSIGPLKPIFPFEINQAKPKRVFPADSQPSSSSSSPSITTNPDTQAQSASPASPTISVNGRSGRLVWSNAWDEDLGIRRYMSKHFLTRIQSDNGGSRRYRYKAVESGTQTPVALSPNTERSFLEAQQRRPSLKLTDFPSEIERPSLPVTPAPIHRRSFWGQERDEAGDLPQAEGVPHQSLWDPQARLTELQRRQSEVLTAGPPDLKPDIPRRSLPESSALLPGEEVKLMQAVTESELTEPQVEGPFSAPLTYLEQESKKEPLVSPTEA